MKFVLGGKERETTVCARPDCPRRAAKRVTKLSAIMNNAWWCGSSGDDTCACGSLFCRPACLQLHRRGACEWTGPSGCLWTPFARPLPLAKFVGRGCYGLPAEAALLPTPLPPLPPLVLLRSDTHAFSCPLQAKRCHIAIDGDQHQQQQQAQPPLIPLQLQLQLQLPLPRTLLGPAHGLVALLVGSGGTPAAAADRLEAAILENGDFYCNGCKVKCCLACTVRCVLRCSCFRCC